MPAVTLIQRAGKLVGLTDKDESAYQRFRARIAALQDSCILFRWREPRSGPFHRRFFAQLNALCEQQERFEDIETILAWAKVGAGHCEFLPHPEKGLVAIPKSINFEALDQAEFSAVADKIIGFFYTDHARRTLWPYATDEQTAETVATILQEFE